MYIEVKILTGFNKFLTYSVPKVWKVTPSKGSIVSVPLRNRYELALVYKVFDYKPDVQFDIKPAKSLELFPEDLNYSNFLSRLADYYSLESFDLIRRLKVFLHSAQDSKIKDDKELSSDAQTNINELSVEQQAIFDDIAPNILSSNFYPSLIFGVTGSGKSEIYKKLILESIKNNKSVIFILPEVTLALEFESKFRSYFSNKVEIFSFHSGTTLKNKKILWQKLLNSEPILIIGVHLPVLLPVANLGLILVDEEHETGYQEKKHPRINSKEAALIRAQQYGIPIVLGSATPSLTSFYNVFKNRWKMFELKKRYSGSLVDVKLVNLLEDKKKRKSFWISNELYQAIQDRLDNKEQVIIFLNRRGYSFFVQCKDCGFIFECKNCSISLTLHNDDKLLCHYCDYKIYLPKNCKECSSEEFLKKGLGTQQLVNILKDLFPDKKIERADLDTSVKKNKFKKTLDDFENGDIDILVGTQTITKGFNFPNVTLVGIVWGDIDLSLPVYNAFETTIQKVIQVAGRAGRFKKPGEVIVQVMNKNENLEKFVHEKNYLDFVKYELKNREIFNYPPFTRLLEIELRNKNEQKLSQDCNKISKILSQFESAISVLGPVDSSIGKVKNVYRKSFFVKTSSNKILSILYPHLKNCKISGTMFTTPNPL